MSGYVKLLVDDDVLVAQLVAGLTQVGLTVSNVPGADNTLRVHRATPLPNVSSLAERRQRDRETDGQIRRGFRSLFFDPREDGPGAA